MNWIETKVVKKLQIESFVTAFEATYKPSYIFCGENHNFWEFVYVSEGRICVVADDRVHHLKAGDIIFHKPMEFHKFRILDDRSARVFIMSFYLSGEHAALLENGVFTLNTDSHEKITLLIESLKKNKPTDKSNNFLSNIKENGFMLQEAEILTELFLLSMLNGNTQSKEMTTRTAIIYKKIINIMKDNVEKNLTIEDIARQCEMSASNLKKIYSMNSVFSIHKYFMKLKISRAIELLKKGYNVSEISEKLAFNNQNYFSIVFKRETSMSPLNYRKKVLEK